MEREKYLCMKIVWWVSEILLEPHSWEVGIDKSGILNLLEIPHFGQSLEIKLCSKMLLSCFHRGNFWIEPLVSIDTQIIVRIITLLKLGEDPTKLFTNKVGDKFLSETTKDEFHTFWVKRGLYVKNIRDDVVWFFMQISSYKLLRKCRKDEVSTTVISVVEKYVKGVQMNWATFLLNHFFIDCI